MTWPPAGVTPYYCDAWAALYCGDSREVLPQLDLGAVELVCTDPPYGIRWDGRKTRGPNGTGKSGPTRSFACEIVGDTVPFDPTPWLAFPRVVLWGYHHYAPALPTGSILVWLKRHDPGFGSFLSDADLAWMKGGYGVYCFRDLSLQGESTVKTHPTQKPVPLMQWCLQKAGGTGLVLDPYCGSGSTLVAAKNLQRQTLGIEIEERYCANAARRLAQEVLPLREKEPTPCPP